MPAAVLGGLLGDVLEEVSATDPGLVEDLVGGPGTVVQPGSPVDELLGTGFGSCDFNALPTP